MVKVASTSNNKAQQFLQRAANMTSDNRHRSVAYLCMEYGLKNNLPIYSGGLGVLAGDTLKSAADLGMPMVAVGLLYRDGYFRQRISGGRQHAETQKWNPNGEHGLIDLDPVTAINHPTIEVAGNKVQLRLWGHEVKGVDGDVVPLFLLDSLGVSNPFGYDEITKQLYPSGSQRLLQEMVLGIGGVRTLNICGLPIAYYHLNEGHAAFATVEVLRQLGKSFEDLGTDDFQRVREMFSFTTHTPVPAGFDKFYISDIAEAFSDPFLRTAVLSLGKDPLNQSFINMALLAMRLSAVRNGVSKLHAEVSEAMFPDFTPIIPITNGVHHLTWVSRITAGLLDQYCPAWKKDPTRLQDLFSLKDDQAFRAALWQTHRENKKNLLQEIKNSQGIELSEDVFTIGFARRFAGYKRGNLIFTKEEELIRLAEEIGGLQLVFAGKAHPDDNIGQGIIAQVIDAGRRLSEKTGGRIKFVFLPNYNMELGGLMTAGVDAWLNNPQRPYEASGTSGMKAALNGVPNMSIKDGWWVEKRGGGWTIGNENQQPHDQDPQLYWFDSASLYQVIRQAGRAYNNYNNNPAFIDQMIESLAGNGAYFNTHRMVQDYGRLVWTPKVVPSAPLPAASVETRKSIPQILEDEAEIIFAIAQTRNDSELETLLAESLIKSLPGCFRVTRYDAHHESVRIERRWREEHFAGVVYEEIRSERGASGFDYWRRLKEFSGEVMADLLRQRKIQIVSNPKNDGRCYRDGKLVSPSPFILVPEIVNGKIRGAYKLDFPDSLNIDESIGRIEETFINLLMEGVGKAKSQHLSEALARDFATLNTEAEVINWALTLATAGGFVDMPRYSAETNRVAVFLANGEERLVGIQAIGNTTATDHWQSLQEIGKNIYREGYQRYLRQLDPKTNSTLNQHIRGKDIGANVIQGVVDVRDSLPIWESRDFDGGFDSRQMQQLKESIEKLFAVEGRTIENYLLIPIKDAGGRVYGVVYIDNAFSNDPLVKDKYSPIIEATMKRIAELRAR